MVYDLAIVGGGPAGAAAGVYAARKRLKTAFITKDFAGQSAVSFDVQNWIGTVSITGDQLSKNLKEHLKAYAGDVLEIHENHWVKNIEKKSGNKNGATFLITTDSGSFEAKTVLVTTGSYRRKLDVPGAAEYENKGITYCASCDGPLFADMDVVVIGGGNAAFETAAQLLAYCKSVTLLQRGETFRADELTVEKIKANPKFKAITNVQIDQIKGTRFAEAVVYTNKTSGKKVELPTKGIFVEIGLLPNTSFVKDLLKLDTYNHIVVDPRTQRASVEGVWAAGDCTDGLYHQNNIAAGDAVKALEDIYGYVHLHSH
jgi:NADH-dependent peroxiredoxin subunit F